MKKPYTILILLFCLILPFSLTAQTWKPVGLDELNNPSFAFCPYTSIAIAPDGTPYIAYNDNTLSGRVTVKKFDGFKWIVVGQQGFSEGYYAMDISIVFSPDGTPYVSYMYSMQGQNTNEMSVRKFSGNHWVKVGFAIETGLGPTLAFTHDNTPYIAFNTASVSGWSVSNCLANWQDVGNSYDYGTNVANSSKIVITPQDAIYIAYVDSVQKVSVKQFVSGSWQLVGQEGFSNQGASGVTMAIDSTGNIYVAYVDAGNSNKAMVQEFKNGKWSVISATGVSAGVANYLKLALAPDQTPYITFDDAGSANKAVVKKYNGSTWVYVGTGAISLSNAGYNDLAIDKNGVLYTIYQDNSINAEATVKKFSNNQWTDVGMGDVSSEPSGGLVLKVNSGDTAFVAFNDAVYSSRASVKQFVAGAWQYVGTPGISKKNVPYLDMALTTNGMPYVFFSDSTKRYEGTVEEYNGTTWMPVGGAITSSGGGISYTKIAIGPDNTPYVAYSDNGQYGDISVQKYSGSKWSLVGTAGLSGEPTTAINIAVSQSNVLYAAYLDYNSTPNLKIYSNGAWSSVGKIAANGVSHLNMAIGPDGTPYVAYYDPSTLKIAVQSYVNNSWGFVGGAAATTSSSDYPSLAFDKGGQVYLGITQLNGSPDTETVKKLVQGTWVNAGNRDISGNARFGDALSVTSTGSLLYAYLAPQVFARTLTSDSLPAPPVVVSCTPNYGSTGTVIDIGGFNFSGTTSVLLGTSPVASYKVISPTQIIAVAGKGASGLVSVTNAYGTGTYDSYVFTTPPPVITSFLPHFGAVGSSVTINGESFNTAADSNIVYFGSVTAQVVSANDSTLVVKVPTGSSYAPISVTTNHLTGYADTPFDVTFKSTGVINSKSFAAKQDFQSIANPSGALIMDMDNDGKPDITDNAGNVMTHRNISTIGHLNFQQKIVLGGGYTYALSDFDGDGRVDIAYAEAMVTLADNSSVPGNINFPLIESFQPLTSAFDIAAADLDGDGRPDIITANNTAFALTILPNSGASKGYTYFANEIDLSNFSPTFPDAVVVADLNGDGKPDIVTESPNYDAAGTSYIVILKNTSTPGEISFVKVAQILTGSGAGKPVFTDIDGDGKPDMIIPNSGSNTLSVFRNTGTLDSISFAASVNFTTGTKPIAVCAADFDGDGKPDIAVTNESDNTVSVLKNTSSPGNIAFAAKTDFATGHSPTGIAAGDLDGDGAPELVIANSADTTISVLRNNMAPTPSNIIVSPQLANVTYGAHDTTLTATSSDTIDPILFTSSNNNIVQIINGNTAHIVGAGSAVITAQQPNGTAYPITGVLTVLPAPLTIAALNEAKLMGAENPKLTLSYQGFVNGDDTTAFIAKPVVSTTATISSPAGSYPITVNGGTLSNYTITDVNGTLIVDFTLPASNFTLAATSASCRGDADGAITITAAQSMSYTATITGSGVSQMLPFNTTAKFSDLEAGTYQVCVTIAGQANYQQCFDVVIAEPAALSVNSVLDSVNDKVTLSLSGGTQYNITLNGILYTTTNNSITLPLFAGNNNLTVTTDQICQGTVQNQINFAGNIIPYPDPFQGLLNLNLGNTVFNNLAIQIRSAADGSLVMSKKYTGQSGVLQLDVSSLNNGVYVLQLTMDNTVKTFKIIKK